MVIPSVLEAGRSRSLFVVLALALATVAAVQFRTEFLGFDVWRPFVRDRSYRTLVADFNRASVSQWDFAVRLPSSGVTARVHAMDVVAVAYSDEAAERKLYEYRDKSDVISIRTTGQILYVHWIETLPGRKHWLIAYDLLNRRELARARVDPTDLRSSE